MLTMSIRITHIIWAALLVLVQNQSIIEPHSPLLYVSTLDGTFYALDAATGTTKWKIKEDKVVTIPHNFQENQKFFPDPLDGSLYIVNRGSIEKLQHTIPEMVNSSPMKTRAGLLYAGKKTDYWVALNPDSGDKHASVTTEGIETCTAVSQEENSLYVGKTEYSLTIVDSKTSTQTWNVTYVSYVAPKLNDLTYEYTHYASSSDGMLITFNTDNNKLLWHNRLNSPVISLFVDKFGSLLRVSHRTLAADTITSYILEDIRDLISEHQKHVVNCLFIGKYAGGIYAMNEMMHSYDVNTPRPRFPEIGPPDDGVQTIGRHVLPMLPDHLLISHIADDFPKEHRVTNNKGSEPHNKEDPVQMYLVIAVGVIVVLVVVVFVVMFLMYAMIQSLKDPNSSLSRTNNSNNDDVPTSRHTYTVGKIDVYLGDIIGHGSEGTVVFKGRFERRDVAVKRVLLDFIDIDLHEVELLRQADEHPNVIRYFCMETDSMFRYLALELCQASLRHYVENNIFNKNNDQNKSLLFQTISGLNHLHSLNIVHRDMKPGNILVTKCRKQSNTLKALISDFGLCRKISEGRQSLTARTGSAGTDGWIAPEMLLPATKISCAVDIFSYGCIMYYVLSDGQHPFGNDVYRRQNNIRDFDYDLSSLAEPTQDNVLAVSLVVKMVGSEQACRPTSNYIAMHPYFWNAAKQLRFYSDVSDRVEKEETSELVLRWEHNCVGTVLRGGWMLHCPELQHDLHKYRKYKTDSVRDLLRAMRNKRHHYRELPEDLKATLGNIPDGYMDYFSSRFPRLLLHSYTIMTECSSECVFRHYYPEISTFREERLEMPRYHTPDPPSPTASRLALDLRGEYTTGEIIKTSSSAEPPPATQTSKADNQKEKKKKEKNTKNRSKQAPVYVADEVLSWRRNSRTASESSDQNPHKSSDPQTFSDKNKAARQRYTQPNPAPSKPEFQITTGNKFHVFVDESSDETPVPLESLAPEAPPCAPGLPPCAPGLPPPGFSKPWFERFDVRETSPKLVKRRVDVGNES